MSNDGHLTTAERLAALLAHLGLRQAHFAGRMLRDWTGLVAASPHSMTSLTLAGPTPFDPALAGAIAPRLLVIGGDRGPVVDRLRALARQLPQSRFVELSDYAVIGWTDLVAERTDEIGAAMLDFLAKADAPAAAPATFSSAAGDVAGLTYRIRGSGPPLVLLPLFLAPSQWEPLVPALAQRYTTITVGGPVIGAVGVLEARGRAAGYEQMLRALVGDVPLPSGARVLDVGSGSGVVSRWLARHTRGAAHVVGVDINRYLLDEATALARRDGLGDVVGFREGSAETLPFDDATFDLTLSVTVIEEVDAQRLLAEMVRVTRPGGRVAVVARAMDVAPFMNLPLPAALKAKIDAPGFLGVVSEHGCADASLYRRVRDAGLVAVTGFPHMTAFWPRDGSIVDFIQDVVFGKLDPHETAAWHQARAAAGDAFFVTWPHHCAIGTRP